MGIVKEGVEAGKKNYVDFGFEGTGFDGKGDIKAIFKCDIANGRRLGWGFRAFYGREG